MMRELTPRPPKPRVDPPDKHRLPNGPVREGKQATKSGSLKAFRDGWRLSSGGRAETTILLSAWAVYLIYYVSYAFGKEASWS